jgi:uncharacterized protein
MRTAVILVFLALSVSLCAQHTINSVPDPNLDGGHYVSNPDNIISPMTAASLNSRLVDLEVITTVQVAVVVVKSIDTDEFTFAQNLFNEWGIGHADKDNGLLILVVTDLRVVRFQTGNGLESALPDATCKKIQRDFMIPHFQEGNYDKALHDGVNEVREILSDPKYAEELRSYESFRNTGISYGNFALYLLLIGIPLLGTLFLVMDSHEQFVEGKKVEKVVYPEMLIKRKTWFMAFVLVPGIIFIGLWIAPVPHATEWCIGILYLWFMGTLIYRLKRARQVTDRLAKEKSYHDAVEFLRKQKIYLLVMGIVFPVPFLFYFFYHLSRTNHFRNHPRACKACGGTLLKLNEASEDAYLAKNQQLEEKLKSVNYDVWKCEKCAQTEIQNYVNRLSSYDDCYNCKTKAVYLITDRTVTESTYSAPGVGESHYKCKNCNSETKRTYKIAQKTEQKETYSRSDSDDSYSDESSSSDTSSWAGGSSGGGGASSKW